MKKNIIYIIAVIITAAISYFYIKSRVNKFDNTAIDISKIESVFLFAEGKENINLIVSAVEKEIIIIINYRGDRINISLSENKELSSILLETSEKGSKAYFIDKGIKGEFLNINQ